MKSSACRLLGVAALASVLFGGSCTWAFSSNTSDHSNNGQGGTVIVISNATFGGSSMSVSLAGVPGVTQAAPGWDGDGPFLGAWLASWTGHRRVSRISFDTSRITLEKLLAEARQRATGRWLNFYAQDDAQASQARKAWPAGSTPELCIRRASGFLSAAE